MAEQIVDEKKFTGSRLPTNIKPVHYDLFLNPNFKEFTFVGQVKIDYVCATSNHLTNSIVVNALEIKILDGTTGSTKNNLTRVTYSNDTATLEFQNVLEANGTLCLNFTGALNDKLKGFYRTTYKVEGETVYAAATQFEPTDARRCFPCWDEPAFKATFSVSIAIEKYMTIAGKQYERLALSNMPEVSRTPANDSQVLVKFDKTPIMSTYLLAFVVGPFDVIETLNKGRPVRVYTTPGNKELGRYALGFADKSLSFYENYFEIDYPLPKMDLIAIPDFAFGAMENWGLITYREKALLVDPENTSAATKQIVAIIVAHEIAHQWFGNLVTMEWWTHLWLNEGFASFMEYMCVDSIQPEFNIWEEFVTDSHDAALALDALNNSHPIEVPVKHSAEINEIFDDISYKKGSAVIRMLYQFIGDESFRKGMKAYLTKFAYKNALTEDLWDSLEEASGKPVRALMSGWTSRRGYPWLDIKCSRDSDDSVKLNITQSKFIANGQLPEGDELNAVWMVPISALTGKEPATAKEICLLSNKTAEIRVENVCDSWLKLNPGSVGLYRSAYPQEMLNQLQSAIEIRSLPAMDRLNLQNDLFALCQAGKASTVDLLKFLMAFTSEDNYSVWASIDSSISRLMTLVSSQPKTRDNFNAYCCKLYSQIHDKLQWDAKPGEHHCNSLARGIVLNRLVSCGDKKVIEEAKSRFTGHLNKSAVLAADVRAAVYKAVATYGQDDSFDGLFELYKQTELSEEKTRVARGLASTKDPERLKRVVEFAMSDEVKIQDKTLVLAPIGPNHPDVLFKVLQDKREFILEKYGTYLLAALVKSATCYYTSEEKANEIEKYFESHPFPGAERAIQQSLETIRLNASWLARDFQTIKDFLSTC